MASSAGSYCFRTAFELGRKISWYPGHMRKAIRRLAEEKLSVCHVVIEVRDGRAPFSSANPELNVLAVNKPRIVVLNKMDLALTSRKQLREIAEAVKMSTNNCKDVLYTCALSEPNENMGIYKCIRRASSCLPNRFKTTPRVILVVGVPNVGKSSLINAMSRFSAKKAPAKTGKLPGLTRDIQAFKVSDSPPVFIMDSPGIMLPRFDDDLPETPLKLGLCGIIKDELIGVRDLADYLLFYLNTHGRFEYQELFGLEYPTDDIDQLLSVIHSRIDAKAGAVNITNAANHFLRQFRSGRLGKFLLDEMHGSQATESKPIVDVHEEEETRQNREKVLSRFVKNQVKTET